MENLALDHAEGETVAALALRHQLPADYIEAVLNASAQGEDAGQQAISAEETEA